MPKRTCIPTTITKKSTKKMCNTYGEICHRAHTPFQKLYTLTYRSDSFFFVKYGCIRNTEAPVNKKKNLSSVSTKTNRIKYSRIYVANGHSMCNGPQIFRRTPIPKSTYRTMFWYRMLFYRKKEISIIFFIYSFFSIYWL